MQNDFYTFLLIVGTIKGKKLIEDEKRWKGRSL